MKAFFLNIIIFIYIFSIINCYDSKEDYTAAFLNKIKIGLEPHEIYLLVNTLSSKSVLFTNAKREYSEEIKKGRKDNKITRGIELSGELINSFIFNLQRDKTKLKNKQIQGEFGLGINKDNSSDLIDILYEREIIYYKALELETSKKEDVINIKFEPHFEDFTYCDLAPKKIYKSGDLYYESWMCHLSHMLVGSNKNELMWDKAVDINGRAVLDSRSKYIYIPKQYKKYILKMWNLDNNKKCKSVHNLENEDLYYICNRDMKSELYTLQSIYLIMGGYGYRLRPENLFEDDGNNLNSLIRFTDDGENIFVLGIPFFREYNILLVYSDTKIGFKGEDIINYNKEYKDWNAKVKKEEAELYESTSCEKIIAIVGGIIGALIILYISFYFYREYRKEKPNHIELREQYNNNEIQP